MIDQTWISCSYDQNSLDAATYLKSENYPGLSSVQCIALATLYNWVYLVLMGGSSGCTLYELNAVAVGDVVKGPTGGDPLCKVQEDLLGEYRH